MMSKQGDCLAKILILIGYFYDLTRFTQNQPGKNKLLK